MQTAQNNEIPYQVHNDLVKIALQSLLTWDLNDRLPFDMWEGATVAGREFDINFYSDAEYGTGVTNGTNAVAYEMYWDEHQQSWSRDYHEPIVLFTRWGADLTLEEGVPEFKEI
jgi:hypothetical protein